MDEWEAKSIVGSRAQATLLYVTAFLMSFSIGMLWVAMPFIIKRLGGTDAEVGVYFATNMGFYAFGCLATGALLGHLRPKRVIHLGAGSMGLIVAVTTAVVFMAERAMCPFQPILLMFVMAALSGVSMSFFWPFLMGWLSTGHEGKQLNRQLGIFNVSWSSGGVISPLFGGLLVERGSFEPLLAATGGLVLCFVAVSFAGGAKSVTASTFKKDLTSDIVHPLLPQFRWVAMVGLFFTFLCFGLFRSQLGLLLKYELDFSESTFGVVVMVLSMANFLVMVVAGRTHYWHYRLWVYVVACFGLVVGMLMIIYGGKIWSFLVAAVVLGSSGAFIYSSHLYYGVSGSKRRSARMAIHETVLSIGFFNGSLVGGYLSNHFGRYMPYWFALGVLAVGFVGQTLVWLLAAPRRRPRTRYQIEAVDEHKF